MLTRKHGLRFYARMARMTAVGVCLLLAGILHIPPKALRRRLHKEN